MFRLPAPSLSAAAITSILSCLVPPAPALAGECVPKPGSGNKGGLFHCSSGIDFSGYSGNFGSGTVEIDFTVAPEQCGRLGFGLRTGWAGNLGETGPIPPGESRRLSFAQAFIGEGDLEITVRFYDPPCTDAPSREWLATIDERIVDN